MRRVFVNGTFDLIHCGHLELLNYARSLGDYLLVAIDEDERVRQLKGSSRPINSVYSRKALLENLRAVNEVQTFGSDEELKHIIRMYAPSTMVVGSDYLNKPVIGSEHAEQLVFFDRLEGYSSTQIYNKIKSENEL